MTHASTVRALAHPQVGFVDCRSSSVAFLSFHFPRSHRNFHFSACFSSSVFARPHLSRTSSRIPLTLHWATYGATAAWDSSSLTLRSSPAFCPYILSRFEQGFTVGLQPSRITGPQATSPKRRPPRRIVLFNRFSPGYILLWIHRSLGFLP